MHTVLWIIFIALIVVGIFYLGMLCSVSLMIFINATMPDKWDNHVKILLQETRDWVDAGNKFSTFPIQRVIEIMNDDS